MDTPVFEGAEPVDDIFLFDPDDVQMPQVESATYDARYLQFDFVNDPGDRAFYEDLKCPPHKHTPISIRRNAAGQPELVYGRRRLLAARKVNDDLGWENDEREARGEEPIPLMKIRCQYEPDFNVEERSGDTKAMLSMVMENERRRPDTPMNKARKIGRVIERLMADPEFCAEISGDSEGPWDYEDLCARYYRYSSKAMVRRYMKLHLLINDVQDALDTVTTTGQPVLSMNMALTEMFIEGQPRRPEQQLAILRRMMNRREQSDNRRPKARNGTRAPSKKDLKRFIGDNILSPKTGRIREQGYEGFTLEQLGVESDIEPCFSVRDMKEVMLWAGGYKSKDQVLEEARCPLLVGFLKWKREQEGERKSRARKKTESQKAEAEGQSREAPRRLKRGPAPKRKLKQKTGEDT